LEYPIKPIAVNPTVMQLERTNAPPSFSIKPFQEIRIMTGTINISITDLRLRHCVVKSARSREASTAEVAGMLVRIF
jgi:hypothetical protein